MNQITRFQARNNRELVEYLRSKGVIESQEVFEIMCLVDRGKFVNNFNPYNDAYIDAPQSIGHCRTISAPHMHAVVLENLVSKLKKGKKALTVRCCTGYVSTCIALMLEPNGLVVNIESIPELHEKIKKNIENGFSDLLENKRIQSFFGNERNGLPFLAPYDVIYIGAAAENVPQSFIDQLAVGGRLIMPVGSKDGNQILMQIDKYVGGNLIKTPLLNVKYGYLDVSEPIPLNKLELEVDKGIVINNIEAPLKNKCEPSGSSKPCDQDVKTTDLGIQNLRSTNCITNEETSKSFETRKDDEMISTFKCVFTSSEDFNRDIKLTTSKIKIQKRLPEKNTKNQMLTSNSIVNKSESLTLSNNITNDKTSNFFPLKQNNETNSSFKSSFNPAEQFNQDGETRDSQEQILTSSNSTANKNESLILSNNITNEKTSREFVIKRSIQSRKEMNTKDCSLEPRIINLENKINIISKKFSENETNKYERFVSQSNNNEFKSNIEKWKEGIENKITMLGKDINLLRRKLNKKIIEEKKIAEDQIKYEIDKQNQCLRDHSSITTLIAEEIRKLENRFDEKIVKERTVICEQVDERFEIKIEILKKQLEEKQVKKISPLEKSFSIKQHSSLAFYVILTLHAVFVVAKKIF